MRALSLRMRATESEFCQHNTAIAVASASAASEVYLVPANTFRVLFCIAFISLDVDRHAYAHVCDAHCHMKQDLKCTNRRHQQHHTSCLRLFVLDANVGAMCFAFLHSTRVVQNSCKFCNHVYAIKSQTHTHTHVVVDNRRACMIYGGLFFRLFARLLAAVGLTCDAKMLNNAYKWFDDVMILSKRCAALERHQQQPASIVVFALLLFWGVISRSATYTYERLCNE